MCSRLRPPRVFKFEEQEELHNNIIDKGLLKLCQANLKRAEIMARRVSLMWKWKPRSSSESPSSAFFSGSRKSIPSLLILARHGGHRIDDTDMGSQSENLCRLSPSNVLLIGTTDVRPDDIPWIEEDGEKGLEWAPDAEVRIMRVPPFALGIARKAVEEFVMENYGPAVPEPSGARDFQRGGCPDEWIIRRPGRGSARL